MDGVTEFLNSSTIHGLSHISTARNLAMKVVWAILVMGSFVTAAFIICNSFDAWEKSPVITSSGINHISKLKFPKVTVCPPLGTNTGLNEVLEKSRYITLLPWMTADLAAYSKYWLAQDEYHLEFVDEMISFTNIDNIKNYCKAVTGFSLPSEYEFIVFTSATPGSLIMPWFGEPFSLGRTK